MPAPNKETKEPGPLDAIALTLAIWLGVVVCMTGLSRLTQEAAIQAALAEAAEPPGVPDRTAVLNPVAMAFGG